jgi:protein-L-isoaspartate(D-aspartate) O-methyltransferase
MQSGEPTRSNDRHPSGAAAAAPAATMSAGPDAARARMASELRQHGHALSPSVQDAFATVPRHVFVPEIGPAAAYRDEALVIKCGPDGLPISSSSQPAMMAIMLDQLGLQRGHRVLEIGTGSGYNAAVMSAVVGPGGDVVTIDIDPELVARATASLRAAGADAVTVRCADGGYGDPDGAPFDRVIVTAGAWDIAPAWLDQLAPGGRLVLPLSIRGIQLSVGLERTSSGWWLSTSACRCGFVRMLGAFAGPEEVIRLDEPQPITFQVSDGNAVDTGALLAALSGEACDEPVPVALASIAELADLDLWLTMSAGRLDRLTVLAGPGGSDGSAPTLPFGALVSSGAHADRLGIGMLLPVAVGSAEAEREYQSGLLPGPEPAPGRRPGAEPGRIWTAMVRGLGPGGPELAARLAALSGRWARLGRPRSTEMEVLVWPAGAVPSRVPAGRLLLRRPSITIAAGWPVGALEAAQRRR